MNDSTLTLRSAPGRYEALAGGRPVGHIDYDTRDGGTIVMRHTEVNPAAEGQGVGSFLARAALDDARQRGLRVVPQCSFVAAFIERHPAYADLVAR